MELRFVRPEILEILLKINWMYFYENKNLYNNSNKYSIYDKFWFWLEDYKKNYINNFDENNIKIWWIFWNRNSYNLFNIFYKNSKSTNIYWIKRYMLKKYIESDILVDDKIELLKKVIVDFYTKEKDINQYIFWNENFIYKDFSEQELEIFYKKWLFIYNEDIDKNIFKKLDNFSLKNILDLKSLEDIKKSKKWKIFISDKTYNYFLYFSNNIDSFRKYKIRNNLIKDFLKKDTIWLDVAIKYVEILIDYIKNSEDILSTPLRFILDDLKEFNNKYINTFEKIDTTWNSVFSNIELDFLWIFFDTNKIRNYTYYEDISYMDSKYLKDDENNKIKWFRISHLDYNNLFR